MPLLVPNPRKPYSRHAAHADAVAGGGDGYASVSFTECRHYVLELSPCRTRTPDTIF